MKVNQSVNYSIHQLVRQPISETLVKSMLIRIRLDANYGTFP